MKKEALSRREALKGVGVLGVAGLAMIGSTSLSASAVDKKDVKFDEEYDVIVIGSGFAALAAGIKAAQRGNTVLMIEKMGRLGGNSTINGGVFTVVDSKKQHNEGIKDSKELFLKDTLKAGLNINHTDLLETIVKRSKDALALTEECGAKYRERLEHLGGHSVPRSYSTANGSGSGIVLPMIDYFQKLKGAKVLKRTKFDDFVIDGDRVVGVVVRENYRFDSKLYNDDLENKTGVKKVFKAKKGVVLASGGFCRDKFYRKQQDPRLHADVDSTNQPGATAGALLKAFEIGAVPVQVSWIQFGPWACPDEKGFGVSAMFNVNATFRYGISVDPRTGKRYMDELADRKTRADAMFKVIDTKKNIFPINICDDVAAQKLLEKHREKPLEAGTVKKFNTIEELAKAYGIPAEQLKKTIKTYNDGVKAGKDEFGKPVHTLGGATISKAPFYATRGVPKLHHTMGGLKINEKAQVISTKTDKPIPGLYAAGEITGGVHGASRLGSVAITDCLTFGMIAGENI